MRRAITYTAAFDFYRKHQSYLNNDDYEALLQAYCRLSFRGDLEAARYAVRKVKAASARSKVKDNQQLKESTSSHSARRSKKKFFTKSYFM
jgi:hypothetical protein